MNSWRVWLAWCTILRRPVRDVSVPPKKGTASASPATVGRTPWDVIAELLVRRDLLIALFILIVIGLGAIAAGVASGNLMVTWDKYVPTIQRVPASHVACIWITGSTTGNKCQFAVTVTSFVAVDAAGHEQTLPCYGPQCTVPPDFSGPLLSPPGLQITRVVTTQ